MWEMGCIRAKFTTLFFFFSSRRRHTRSDRDWSSDVCSSDLHLRERFGHGAQGGVHLLTLHRAKGLEFEAVFLPRVEEKELPCKPALRNPEAIADERRLLYVGLTRAKRHLALSWTQRPSRFLAELGIEAQPTRRVRKDEAELPPQYATL